MRLVKALSLA